MFLLPICCSIFLPLLVHSGGVPAGFRNVPEECGGCPATKIGLPCSEDSDCGTRGRCVCCPAIPACDCYPCREYGNCTQAQLDNCPGIVNGQMWTNCTTAADCTAGNICNGIYHGLCKCKGRGFGGK